MNYLVIFILNIVNNNFKQTNIMTKKKNEVPVIELEWMTAERVALKPTTKRFLIQDKSNADEYAKYKQSYVGESFIDKKDGDGNHYLEHVGYHCPL